MLVRDADDPIAVWQFAERYLGVGTRTYSPFAADLDIADEFHPQVGVPSFRLPSFVVPAGLGEYRGNAIASDLHRHYRTGAGFLLPVHPNALDCADLAGRDELARCAPGPQFEVVPSANARTVFVSRIGGAPVPPHFVKLHYPRRLSRFTRRLRRPAIESQLWVAQELRRAGVPVLPDVGGGSIDCAEPWGFLVRAGASGPGFTVPLFALYGADYHAPHDPTLLEQLVAASGEAPADWAAERVIRPMVAMWVRAARRTGCALETHGQNTLFRFTADGRSTGVGYRDCAIYVAAAIRRRLGLGGLPPTNVIPRDVPMPAEEVLSLTYDSFMGHHALSYLAEVLRRRCGVAPARLRDAAREAFRSAAAGERLLPDTIFYYDDLLYETGDWKLVDTGEPPLWR
jgi:hypothetical protein